MELNTNELRLIQPGGEEMREYAENTQGYYAAKGLHGSVPDDSEKKILAEMYAPEESTEMHFPGVIIVAAKDGEVLGHIRLGEPCRGEVAVCCRFMENGAYAAEALKAVTGEALRSSGVNRLTAVCPGRAAGAFFEGMRLCGEKKPKRGNTALYAQARAGNFALYYMSACGCCHRRAYRLFCIRQHIGQHECGGIFRACKRHYRYGTARKGEKAGSK